jgi:hypothetical protein
VPAVSLSMCGRSASAFVIIVVDPRWEALLDDILLADMRLGWAVAAVAVAVVAAAAAAAAVVVFAALVSVISSPPASSSSSTCCAI